MTPKQLSRQLREDGDHSLARRRGIVACGLAAAGAMGVIALYQIGIIKHLPEPPLPGFDADKVDASEEAYSYFQTPDAFIGLGSYAATMGLAAMGAKNRAETKPGFRSFSLPKPPLTPRKRPGSRSTNGRSTRHFAYGACWRRPPLSQPCR
jgi:hypothetical protein